MSCSRQLAKRLVTKSLERPPDGKGCGKGAGCLSSCFIPDGMLLNLLNFMEHSAMFLVSGFRVECREYKLL